MFIKPAHIRGPAPQVKTNHTKTITVQICDPSVVTKISQLDRTKSYKRTPKGPVIHFLLNVRNHPIFSGRFDLLTNDTREAVEIQTTVVKYMFTVKPDSTYTFHTSNSISTKSLVTFITPASIPAESRFADSATVYVTSHDLHEYRQFCIKNDTRKWVAVKFMKVTEIDQFLLPKPILRL